MQLPSGIGHSCIDIDQVGDLGFPFVFWSVGPPPAHDKLWGDTASVFATDDDSVGELHPGDQLRCWG